MIHDKLRRSAALVVVGALMGAFVSAGAQDGGRILSNDLWALAGGGDYLWMLSGKGLNYTDRAFADTIRWRAIESTEGTEYTGPMVHGGGRVLVGVAPAEGSTDPGDLVLFRETGGQDDRIRLRYDTEAFDTAFSEGEQPLFMAWDAAWGFGAFWVTMIDGGLAEIRPGDGGADVFLRMPGVEGRLAPAAFVPDTLGGAVGDPARTPQLVEVDTAAGVVWVLCEEKLWRLNRPAGTAGDDSAWTWEAVGDSTTEATAYVGLSARQSADTALPEALYVTVAVEGGDTLLYRYEPAQGTWRSLRLQRSGDVARQVVVGRYPYVFIEHGGQLGLYEDTGPKLDPVMDMMDRIRDENTPSFEPNDVLLTQKGETERLWVATSQGLYYSSEGLYDPEVKEPFVVARRSNRLESDLRETYAYPSIITMNDSWDRPVEAVFAYNLGEDDHVTIDVFDWNMDHVVRIVDDALRRAGSKRTRGRSTVEKEDRWDGTFDNRGSKPVAPGVYYYRITTRKGKRAFGKIIVARN